MKKFILGLAGIALALGLFSLPVWAHPGKTDKKGGHTCRTNCAKYGLKTGQYHKHFVKSTKSKSKSTARNTSRQASKCDRNYSGCVPVASDVDCKPGRGNGPKYVTGPLKVIGKDIYRLDNDKDRIACEPRPSGN